MKSLFILQLVCCVITAMLALQLVMASLQVRWKVWRYEISRWILVASMLFFSVHYLLQMLHGLRAQGTDVGAAFNILFYTPVAFAITLSIINIESTGSKVRRYCLRSMMAYILIAIVFVIGMFKSHSLHIGNMLYVMLGLFVASMAYFILIIRKETKARKQKLMENFGIDLIPYVRYCLFPTRALSASQHHSAILCCWTPSCSNPLQYLIIYNRSLDITLCHLFRPHFQCTAPYFFV